MAIVRMTRRPYAKDGYHYTEIVGTGATGDTVIISPKDKEQSITCTLIAGSNTGKFQVTTSSDVAVNAGTATWQDWALGTKTGTVSDAITSPVTAIRGVSISGAITIEIVI